MAGIPAFLASSSVLDMSSSECVYLSAECFSLPSLMSSESDFELRRIRLVLCVSVFVGADVTALRASTTGIPAAFASSIVCETVSKEYVRRSL